MSLLLTTLLSALVPVGAEGVKRIIASKFPDGVKAVTIDDKVKLDESDIKRAQAIAALDNPGGTPSQWVVDLRASSRYIAAWACILIGSGLIVNGVVDAKLAALITAGAELVSVAFGFLFGVRITANWSNGK